MPIMATWYPANTIQLHTSMAIVFMMRRLENSFIVNLWRMCVIPGYHLMKILVKNEWYSEFNFFFFGLALQAGLDYIWNTYLCRCKKSMFEVEYMAVKRMIITTRRNPAPTVEEIIIDWKSLRKGWGARSGPKRGVNWSSCKNSTANVGIIPRLRRIATTLIAPNNNSIPSEEFIERLSDLTTKKI